MSDQPFMQLYVADYLADTLDLSTVEHGAYLLILMTMWRHDARLPNDTAKLARIARMSPAKFKPVWDEISRFFEVEGDSITNRRLSKEHEKARKKSEVRATAGKAGGHAKALKENKARMANATDLPCHSSESRYQIEDSSLRSESSGGGGNACAREPETGLVAQIAEALGFNDPNGSGWPKYWVAADAHVIASRWITDLGLTASEVIHVAVSNAKAHGAPANGPKILTRHMQDFAAAKRAPPLAPSTATHSAVRPATGHGIKAQIPEEYLK